MQGAQSSTIHSPGSYFQSVLHGTSVDGIESSGPISPSHWLYEKHRDGDGGSRHIGLEKHVYDLFRSGMGGAISMMQGQGCRLVEGNYTGDHVENRDDVKMPNQTGRDEDTMLWPENEEYMIDLNELGVDFDMPVRMSQQGLAKIEGPPFFMLDNNRGGKERGYGENRDEAEELFLQLGISCGGQPECGGLGMEQLGDWQGTAYDHESKPDMEDISGQENNVATNSEAQVQFALESEDACDLWNLGILSPVQDRNVAGPESMYMKIDRTENLDSFGHTTKGFVLSSAVVELSDSDSEKDMEEALENAAREGELDIAGRPASSEYFNGLSVGVNNVFLEGAPGKRKQSGISPMTSKRSKSVFADASQAAHCAKIMEGQSHMATGSGKVQELRRQINALGPARSFPNLTAANMARIATTRDEHRNSSSNYSLGCVPAVSPSTAALILKSSAGFSTQLGALNGKTSFPGTSLARTWACSEAAASMLPPGSVPGALHAMRPGYGSVVGYGHPGTGGARQDVDPTTSSALIGVMEGLQVGHLQEEANVPEGLLRMPLLKHQKLALAWMEKRESSYPAGGILADDQGLGKTVSTISLILKARSPNACTPRNGVLCLPSNGQSMTVNLGDDYEKGSEMSNEAAGSKCGAGHRTGSLIKVISLLDDDDEEHGIQVKGNVCSPQGPNDGKSGRGGHKVLASVEGNGVGMTVNSKPHVKKRNHVSGRIPAGTLVVCPTSVLRQWASELKDKVESEAQLSVLVYHGANRIRNPEELASYGVVLTTYAIVAMEVPKQPTEKEELAEKISGGQICSGGLVLNSKSGSSRNSGGMKVGEIKKVKGKRRGKRKLEVGEDDEEVLAPGSGPLARLAWFRVVLDEAQSIKNRSTQVARACWGLRAKRRWCLSGTPIQNSIDDLYSYFRFLRWQPFDEYSAFRSQIKEAITRNPGTGWKKLQSILQAVMLRRTKATTIDGQPIVSLPPRIVSLCQTEFSPEERSFYTCLEAASREQFQDYAKAGTVQSNYVNILVMLLHLRQACDHPALVKSRAALLVKDEGQKASQEALLAAKQLPAGHVERLLQVVEKTSAICAVCEDAPEDSVISICGHVFCRQCVDERWAWADAIPSQCPSCRKPLASNDIHTPAALRASLLPVVNPIGVRSIPLADCKGQMKRELKMGSGKKVEPAMKLECDNETMSSMSKKEGGCDDVRQSVVEKKTMKTGGPLRGEDFSTSSKIEAMLETLKKLPKMVVEIEDGKVTGRVDGESFKGWQVNKPEWERGKGQEKPGGESFESAIVPSGANRGRHLVETSEKAIVFSQWTSMLNLLEPQLQRAGFCYRRLDGTMSIQARDRAIADFKTRPEVNVIIMSLKAASLGLNMVAACHVLLLDVWWNPATEDQAIDRAHRIGQTRPVQVSRFTVRNTIEDRILELQEKKRTMVASAFGESDGVNKGARLSEDDLHFLFRA